MSNPKGPFRPLPPQTVDALEWFTQDRGIVKGPFPSQVEAWDFLRTADPDGKRPHQLAQVWPQKKART